MTVPWRATAKRVSPLPVVAVVAAVASGLALLRRQPLSWDEAVTVAVATRPVSAIVVTLHHTDAVLGPYYLMMHGWGELLGAVGVRPTETWWRLPSAIAAIATCVVVASFARRVAGPAAGVVAGCSLAVLPLFAFYAVDARPYTPAALVVTFAWWTWTRPSRTSWRRTVPVAVLLIGAAWLQLFTVLVWPAFILAGGRAAARRSAVVLGAATLAVGPLLVVALSQSSEIAWVPAATAINTGRVALHVAGGAGVVIAVAIVVLMAVRGGQLRCTPLTAAVVWWVGAPFTVLAALDVVRPVLVARYALVSLPLAAVGFGVLVARSRRGRRGGLALRVAAGAAAASAVAATAWQGGQSWKYEDYRAAAAFAEAQVGPWTAVVFAPSSARLGFDVYASPGRWHDVALPTGVGPDPLAIRELTPTALRRAVHATCSVVVVGNPLPNAAPNADASKLATLAGWAIHTARGFGQVTVTVLRNPTCAAAPPVRG